MQRTTIYRSSFALVLALAVPAVFPAQSAKPSAHTVKKGDTLWDVSKAYLGDPFLWPQIYKLNTDVVEDPHWIYPGEVLKLAASPGQTAVPAEDTPPPARVEEPQPAPLPQPEVVDTPPPAAAIQVVGETKIQEQGMELFRRHKVQNVANAFASYREVKFRPVRAGEFYSGGFLTEGESFSFGRLLGPVTPEQIETARARAAVQVYTKVAVVPPEGASYAVGDLLLVADRREGPVGYGEIIAPMGMIRVTGENGGQAVGDVISVFGPMREGQVVLPAEKFNDPGTPQYQKVSDGLEGHVLVARDLRELRLPQQVLFLDVGKRDGVALGDLFEARRAPGPQPRASANAVDEVMITLQVIHVRERTATVTVRNVVSPDVRPGTRVKLVAKLPS
ncbi:MAG TPA: LysM peptidoglycan-binding domain-containing protein [Gemmatimonadales bacterium]|jgi:LysM repeat protein|nr:LysM peptidoglycan-binding domain-containing protein [Gemmatimonadales bacterium]